MKNGLEKLDSISSFQDINILDGNTVLTDWINDRMFDLNPGTDLELMPNFSVPLEEPNKIFNIGLM